MTTEKITSDVKGQILTFSWNDQQLTVDYAHIPQHILIQAALHGMRQKIADAGASSKGTPMGTRWAAMTVVYDRIYTDADNAQWNADRKSTANPDATLIEAIYRFGERNGKTTTKDEITERVSLLPKTHKLQLRVQFADIIREIEQEQLGDSVDSENLLESLFE